MVKALKFDKKYIISPLLMALGIFLAFASKMLLPVEMKSFWRIFTEIGGYALIAVGCGVFVTPKE